MSKFIIAGGTGFIGKHLCALLLQEGHDVFILTTQKNKSSSSTQFLHYIYWNPDEKYIDETFTLSGCKIINLAGAGVADKRWTTSRKKEILESRILSLNTLYKALEKKQIQATHLVSASAIGFYGEGKMQCSEEDKSDTGFLSSICREWEEAALQFSNLGIPVSIARIGIVLGKDGGALKEFLKPLQYGIAGIPSDGKQIYSWIHIADVCRMLYFLLEKNKTGIFNAVAPHPVSINEIFSELIKHTKPFFLKVHAPAFALNILLGEMATEVLKSTNVSSHKIEEEGFEFLYKEIDVCINGIMK